MSGFRKLLTVFLSFAALAAMGISGISADYSEVADLELVRTIGIDSDGKTVTLTACSGMGIGEETAVINTAKASSIAGAVNLLRRSGTRREPYFAHVEHVVISESSLENSFGVIPFLDYISRSLETRMDTNIFIVRGSSAMDFIVNGASSRNAAADMLTSLVNDVDMTTLGHLYTCGDVTARLASCGVALIQAVELKENGELGEYGEKTVVPAGFGIIKEKELLGFTEEDVTKGASVLNGTAGYDTVDIETDNGVTVTAGVNSVKVKTEPVFDGDKIKSVVLKLKIRGSVEQANGYVPLTDPDFREALEKKLAGIVKARVNAAVDLAHDLDADFLGIGEKIELCRPVKFQLGGNDWSADFKNIPVTAAAEAYIERSFDIIDPAKVDGEVN